jgi:hypothetical protein
MQVRIDVYIHNEPDPRLDEVLRRLGVIIHQEELEMASLDEVLSDVADEKTQIAGLSTLTAGLKQQLADALSGTTLPPAVQAKVDAVFAGVEANKQAVVDAINVNTPAAPTP